MNAMPDFDDIGDEMLAQLAAPAYSTEAEQSVLGGLMIDNGAWESVCDVVVSDDFYIAHHRLIFTTIARMLGKQTAGMDVVTLSDALDQQKEHYGGLSYLGMLASNTPSTANIKAYALIVKGYAVRRHVQAEVHQLNRMLTEGVETGEVLEHGAKSFINLSLERSPTAAVGMGPLLTRVVDALDRRFQNPDELLGLPTPWTDINDALLGLIAGDLIIVAARPSMGKTCFALNLADHCAVVSGKPTVVFSMEMPAEQLAMRSLSNLGRVDFSRLRKGNMEDTDWPRLSTGISKLSDAPMFIDDSSALSPAELRGRARRFAREHGELGLIVVDYLQLMQVPGYKNDRVNEVSEISRSLKSLAKELNVPVVALSQLNRGLEQRPNKRPVMSDLRDSGAIEQDADVIIFIYRDEVYNPESEDKGTAEIIIGKQRNGPIGTHRLTFIGKYQTFENCAYGRDQEPTNQSQGGTAAAYRGGFE